MLPNKKYCFDVCYEFCFYLFGRRVSGYQLLSQLCHYVILDGNFRLCRQSSKMWRLFMIWLRMSDLWRLQLKLWRLLPKSWQFLIFCEKNAILKILSWSKLWRLWPKLWLLFKVFLVAWFLAWFGKLVAFFKNRPLATLMSKHELQNCLPKVPA